MFYFIYFILFILFIKRPFWLSPRQACVIPISPAHTEYAVKVREELWKAGYFVDVDDGSERFQKKIAVAQTSQYNFILLVGDQEMEHGTVNVRTRDNQQHGEKSVADLASEFAQLVADFQ